MKLYATVTSERDSRPARKGGDRHIIIEINNGVRIVVENDAQKGVIRTYYQKRVPFHIGEWTPQTEIDLELYNVPKQ